MRANKAGHGKERGQLALKLAEGDEVIKMIAEDFFFLL